MAGVEGGNERETLVKCTHVSPKLRVKHEISEKLGFFLCVQRSGILGLSCMVQHRLCTVSYDHIYHWCYLRRDNGSEVKAARRATVSEKRSAQKMLQRLDVSPASPMDQLPVLTEP